MRLEATRSATAGRLGACWEGFGLEVWGSEGGEGGVGVGVNRVRRERMWFDMLKGRGAMVAAWYTVRESSLGSRETS